MSQNVSLEKKIKNLTQLKKESSSVNFSINSIGEVFFQSKIIDKINTQEDEIKFYRTGCLVCHRNPNTRINVQVPAFQYSFYNNDGKEIINVDDVVRDENGVVTDKTKKIFYILNNNIIVTENAIIKTTQSQMIEAVAYDYEGKKKGELLDLNYRDGKLELTQINEENDEYLCMC